jgi:hypothetical protein
MQVKNYYFRLFWKIWLLLYLSVFWTFFMTGSTDVKLLTFTLDFSSLQLMSTALLCLAIEHLHECYFSMLLLCLIISSSCFRSSKLVCSNWKPLSRCVAHIETNLLNTALFFVKLIICPLFLGSEIMRCKTIDCWVVNWCFMNFASALCLWLVTFPVLTTQFYIKQSKTNIKFMSICFWLLALCGSGLCFQCCWSYLQPPFSGSTMLIEAAFFPKCWQHYWPCSHCAISQKQDQHEHCITVKA